jgi:hypothetical protein
LIYASTIEIMTSIKPCFNSTRLYPRKLQGKFVSRGNEVDKENGAGTSRISLFALLPSVLSARSLRAIASFNHHLESEKFVSICALRDRANAAGLAQSISAP